ncbi:endonuclease [Oculatella sp. LEGE 06141]|uniref:endonuclease n=1 Tax=Oculatella sp. LEGE 06141 TaxID=1828648 RepID=UPI001881549E|nr:endonuclease [Oculatella sp. LEGE 06141]MBE9178628.1 endonuclease [Oculatella sp. LEGE 06141]
MQGCYLLHFDRPISDRHTAQHYLGYSDNIENRITQHERGHGSRLCQVAKERDIGFIVAREWIGDRSLERQLKRQKNTPRLCWICNFKW